MDLVSLKQRFGVIGNSELLNRALEVAVRVAPTDLSVLVTGESGVGKEFFPQVIHAYSARKHNKYIAVNCACDPRRHDRFGAVRPREGVVHRVRVEARKGYFEEADGGTIFLDEVAELPLSTQVRLLRVLQTGEFMRVGSAQGAAHRRAGRGGDEHEPAGGHRVGAVPRGPLLPAQHGADRGAGAARAAARTSSLLFRKFAADVAAQYRMPAHHARRRRRAEMLDALLLAGQHPAAEERGRADLGHRGDPPGHGGDVLSRYLPQQQGGFDARGDGGGRARG